MAIEFTEITGSGTTAKVTKVAVTAANPLPVTFPAGGGDASAANQVLEIAAIEAVGAQLPAAFGTQAAATSLSVTLSTENVALLTSTDPTPTVRASATPYHHAAVTTTKHLVATGAQVLTDYFVENPDASAKLYIQMFSAAATADVTLGTTAPKWSIGLEPKQKANLANLALSFPLGLVIAATTTVAGSSAPSTAAVVNLGYRAA